MAIFLSNTLNLPRLAVMMMMMTLPDLINFLQIGAALLVCHLDGDKFTII